MHPYTIHRLATMKMAEDDAYADRQLRARELREARAAALGEVTSPSLLERLITTLRKAVRPTTRPTAGVA
jgi:hypothetical protein